MAVRPLVYLTGPMTGSSPDVVLAWRSIVRDRLVDVAETIDPARGEVDFDRRNLFPVSVERLSHGKQVVTRNRFDLARSDVVLACFLGSSEVSIGSIGEIFWADAMGKPVVVVRADDNVHNHDMLNEIAGWIFSDLELAIAQLRVLLDPSGGRERLQAGT